MLTERELLELGDALELLFGQMSGQISFDVAEKLARSSRPETAEAWLKFRVSATASLRRDVKRLAEQYLSRATDEIKTKMPQMLRSSLDRDLTGIGLDNSAVAREAVEAVAQAAFVQTSGMLKNLTRTTAQESATRFVRVMDMAYLEVSAGISDWPTAMKKACRGYALNGVAVVGYKNSTDTIEVAARRAIVTGVNQGALRMTDAVCDDLGCDLVEASAHAGARPDHAKWQGKIYSRSGKSKKYPSLVAATGYGTGAGLGGWNCRHTFWPWVEGAGRAYRPWTLTGYAEETITVDGSKYTVYEASQRQRSLERQIRALKKEQNALRPWGDLAREELNELEISIARREGALRSLCSQSRGYLKYDKNRLFIYGEK